MNDPDFQSLASFPSPQAAVNYILDYNKNRWLKKFNQSQKPDSKKDYWASIPDRLSGYNFQSNPKAAKDIETVFIVGLPRAGKSSLEKMLEDIENFHAIDEVNLFDEMFGKLNAPNGQIFEYPDYVPMIPEETLLQMGRDYMIRLRDKAQCHDKIIVNTLPINFLYVPLIQRMLPQAKIIWCHRDAKNHCLNMFMKPFISTYYNFTYDMDALVDTFKTYRALHQFYEQKCPDAFMDVHYDDLTKNPRKALCSVIDYIGVSGVPPSDIKRIVASNRAYLNVIEAENAAMRNYTPYFPELKRLK